MSASHFINGRWIVGDGPPLRSIDPSTGDVCWEGHQATSADVDAAVAAASRAFETWSNLELESRLAVLQRVVEGYKAGKESLAETICRDTGKPKWEALAEVDLMVAKLAVSAQAQAERMREIPRTVAGSRAITRFKPLGVLAVLGPFNMPGHLPNGHILPALLAGNCILFKPSEQAPRVGQRMAEAVEAAGVPKGVFNLLQGGRETGALLAAHRGTAGLLFTGSSAAGIALNRAIADTPGRILALEMGGNNPLVFHDTTNADAAIATILQSAYATAGQRCSCARRLIVCGHDKAEIVDRLCASAKNLRVGLWTDEPQPFMGTVISASAADALLAAQQRLIDAGGLPLLSMRQSERSAALLSPGLMDVTLIPNRSDEELFGPLLQIIRVPDLGAALDEANRTAYGLAAGIITDDESIYRRFFNKVRAGIVNWNRPLTGASSAQPFGGVGMSGNHRPGAYFAADYANYPVASLEGDKPQIPSPLPPGMVIL